MQIKDPNDVKDVGRDWSDWLASGETITALTTTPTGVTLNSSSITGAGTQTVAWTSGGTNGDLAKILFHVTTSAGRQKDRTVKLLIRER